MNFQFMQELFFLNEVVSLLVESLGFFWPCSDDTFPLEATKIFLFFYIVLTDISLCRTRSTPSNILFDSERKALSLLSR